MHRRWSIVLGLATLAQGACADPVREKALALLGPEDRGVEPGPLHRPGQPCLLCHDAASGMSGPFSVAGTVYLAPDGKTPLNGARVRMTDADGAIFEAKTNCAGNFWVSASDFAPNYPLRVSVIVDDQSIDMESRIFRDGSCATCHTDPKSPTSAGHVYLQDDPTAERPGAGHFCR